MVIVLFIGILMTGVLGMALGTVDFFGWLQGLGEGMSDMFSISIVAALISGLIGLIRLYGGVEWMVNAITSRIKNRRGTRTGTGARKRRCPSPWGTTAWLRVSPPR